jgi:hypothetical protein
MITGPCTKGTSSLNPNEVQPAQRIVFEISTIAHSSRMTRALGFLIQ